MASAQTQGFTLCDRMSPQQGSYVQPHIRTNPNRTQLDNFSTRGNINPYTGKIGTRKSKTLRGKQRSKHFAACGRPSPDTGSQIIGADSQAAFSANG
jgi:hypothetical protein